MTVAELWEHYENLVAQDDHLVHLIAELENERDDVRTEIRATIAAIEAFKNFDYWG